MTHRRLIEDSSNMTHRTDDTSALGVQELVVKLANQNTLLTRARFPVLSLSRNISRPDSAIPARGGHMVSRIQPTCQFRRCDLIQLEAVVAEAEAGNASQGTGHGAIVRERRAERHLPDSRRKRALAELGRTSAGCTVNRCESKETFVERSEPSQSKPSVAA